MPLTEESGGFVCPQGERFPIEGGIPRFVHSSHYVDAFGEQWNRYVKTQLDSFTKTTISTDRAKACLGDQLWDGINGKHVAELGCGAGRFTEVLLGRGACVTSVDLSSAVEANAKNFPVGDHHRVAQGDILRLPFAAGSFDVMFCLGVIQHTPSPEATITALARHVKPGGHLVIDHGSFSWSWATRTAAPARRLLRRLEPARGIKVTERLVDVFLPLHKRVVTNRPARIVLKRVSPITTFYETYPELDDDQQREWALLDTHDSLTAWFRHYRTPEQIGDLLSGLGFEEVVSVAGGVGVAARGRKPV